MQLDAVSFRYSIRGSWVLSGVDARIERGEVVRVTGSNGAGKSTLLRILTGALSPVCGMVADRPSVIGYAPERFPASQPFSVRGYLEHMSALRGIRGRARTAEVARSLDAFALDSKADQQLGQLSKGTAQKVGLAQAMLGSPQLMVLDEPWSGLDRPSRVRVSELIAHTVARGGSVVFSDHARQMPDVSISQHWQLTDGVLDPTTDVAPAVADDRPIVLQVEVARRDAGFVTRGTDCPRLLDTRGRRRRCAMICWPLMRFQLLGFVKSSRALPPSILGLLVLLVLNGTGRAPAVATYATSAVVMFPIFAWTARQLIETEPDVQRALSAIAVGSRLRAQLTTLSSAAVSCLTIVVAAMVVPWIVGAITVPTGDRLGTDLALGFVLQLLAVVPAVAIGAWASRPVIVNRGASMLTLVGASVASILAGVEAWGGVASAVAPPLGSSARAAAAGPHDLLGHLPMLLARALVWSAVTGAAWLAVRRRRV